ncbi:MAG: type II toxin-antitoxin system HicA family toxin [Alphaproteobacteria bacterium]|nr:type II toxin-antitoxin system HicA family toxin [Alphaproteobacteria bacterium]
MGNSSREIIGKIEADGWYLVGTTGDHHHFRHPTKPGKTTVPHPVRDIKIGTLKSIERQSGVKLR